MYEDKVKKSLRKIIIFAVIIGIFLASIGAGFFYVIRTAFDRSTDERMIEETDNYKKRLDKQINNNFQMLNTVASIIGNSNLDESADFDSILERAYIENDFLTVAFFYNDEMGTLSTGDHIISSDIHLSSLQPEVQELCGERKMFQNHSMVLFPKKRFLLLAFQYIEINKLLEL